MDGTTTLKWPIFAVNFALVYDPQIFDLDAISFATLTTLEIQTIGILKETCLTVKDCASMLGKQLLSIIEPINYGMFEMELYYYLFIGISFPPFPLFYRVIL